MTLQKITVVSGKEFAHPMYDAMLTFITEEAATSVTMNGGKPNHNGVEMIRDNISQVIGSDTYIACEKHKTIEPFAVAFLPEKYNDLSIVGAAIKAYEEREKINTKDDDDDIPSWLKAMVKGGGYTDYPAEMKADLDALELVIVDVAAFPRNEDIYLKVVRKDNPEVVNWIDSYSLKKSK